MLPSDLAAKAAAAPRRVSVLVFEGFELLDVFGPAEVFSQLPTAFKVELVGLSGQPVRSSQGIQVLPDYGRTGAPKPDIALVPGGAGTRRLIDNEAFLTWLREWAGSASRIASVCTGSALLGAAGLLDGYRATSNKLAFDSVAARRGPIWVRQARWVADRGRWTSSGVAAGIDMAVALVRELCGAAAADAVQRAMEYKAQSDPDSDPFAEPSPFDRPAFASPI
ncbi:MAG: DJ-1/PfpI family protein, partial [Bifidobacteriaceae bacterium]|nr:DJ-1/PfpI family protein [Bifidobacteriaceae bacterium]